MSIWGHARSVGTRIVVAFVVTAMAFVLQSGMAASAFAQPSRLTTAAFNGAAQAEISGEGAQSVTTDADGDAYIKLAIATPGVYTIASTSSAGVGGDTYGYLYDSSMALLDESDDCHADTNFSMTSDLAAGTYYLRVTGKETQAGASISVSVTKGAALNSLDCRCEYAANGSVSSLELGAWEHGDKTSWAAADPAAYAVVGYIERGVFIHAQESGAASQLAWKSGLPKEQGRFVVKVSAQGAAYAGDAYFNIDDGAAANALSELDPYVTYSVCGAIKSVELGKYTTVPTNWSTRWDAITAGYYEVAGYCPRAKFEELGGADAKVPWTKGLPRDVGEYVVKCAATNVDENPYTGICYVWTSIDELTHVGSGSWIVDKKATYSTPGQRHLVCAHCGAPCDYEAIAALKDSLETAGSGAALADYKILTSNTARYEVCLSTTTKASVPNSVSIDGTSYKVVSVAASAFAGRTDLKTVTIGKNVTSIGKNAFKGCKALKSAKVGAGVKSIGVSAFKGCRALKTLTLKTTKLKAKGVKKCLAGSSVKTVKVPKSKKKAYAKLFTKKGCGKKVAVK